MKQPSVAKERRQCLFAPQNPGAPPCDHDRYLIWSSDERINTVA
ncbi:hypothetical protein RB2340 [Rhodopirellula baltica SH 1]|uniref:Uncharacterized protein n=1 Tax=Rhodopirellula baltica (strain DSM 10527 / NCIMB 13988 / SH1) TaxID=243090 RepID=Q7UW05_RHOBA|nr:hypothetical protein RB2340 [Rhodopirellula baltica SH 1]